MYLWMEKPPPYVLLLSACKCKQRDLTTSAQSHSLTFVTKGCKRWTSSGNCKINGCTSFHIVMSEVEASHILGDFQRVILIVVQIPPEARKTKLLILWRLRMQNIQIFDVTLKPRFNCIHLREVYKRMQIKLINCWFRKVIKTLKTWPELQSLLKHAFDYGGNWFCLIG